MCQDELAQFGLSEQDIARFIAGDNIDKRWQSFMQFNLSRVEQQLQSGKPLGNILKGRIGLEMRMIIAGGERIIAKLRKVDGDIFQHRPTLNQWDWITMLLKAVIKR
jgi:phytoene/squalene synthetase